MNLTLIGQFFAIFMATLIADIAWTKYFIEVSNKKAVAAASWSAGIVAIGAFTVISYTMNHWLTVAAVAGSWVGTYLTVRREKNKALRALPDPTELDSDHVPEAILLNEKTYRNYGALTGGGPDE